MRLFFFGRTKSDALAGFKTEAEAIANLDRIARHLRDRLEGFGYARAMACMDLVADLKGHSRRRDGTPAILHEISQAVYTLGLLDRGLLDPRDPQTEMLFCLNFSHDLGEDYAAKHCAWPRTPSGYDDKQNAFTNWFLEAARQRMKDPDRQDVRGIAALAWRMGKSFGGEKLYGSTAEYYRNLQGDPLLVIAKGEDRAQNIATLFGGTATLPRLRDYLKETGDHLGGLFKEAKTLYPEFAAVFDTLDALIAEQIALTERLIDPERTPASLAHAFNARSGLAVPPGLDPLHVIAPRAEKYFIPAPPAPQKLERWPAI